MRRQWNNGVISEGMIVYYDNKGKKVNIKRYTEEIGMISLDIQEFHDSLMFVVHHKGKNESFISSNASVTLNDECVVSISIPESKAGLYFVFQRTNEITPLLEMIQLFEPKPLKSKVCQDKPRYGENEIKRKKTPDAVESEVTSHFSSPINQTFCLSPIQQEILQLCLDGRNVFFTGGAGTGKSTLLQLLVKSLRERYGSQSVYVTATTGLAACAIGGVTIHQFGGIKAKDMSTKMSTTTLHSSATRRWKQVRVLIVDEISMLGPDELEFLDHVAKESRSSTLPFGGVQVIFTGDFFQLPPVVQNVSHYMRDCDKENNSRLANTSLPTGGTGGHKYVKSETDQRKYCFESTVWRELFPERSQSCLLSHIYRQQDQYFVSLLNDIRWGNPSEDILENINKSHGNAIDCRDGILPTQICTHRAEVDQLNSQALSSLSNDLEMREYQAIDSGESGYLTMLQKHCPAKDKLQLKIGAQVILVKTIDSAIGLVNGAKGVVVDFTRSTKKPVVKFANSQTHIIGTQVFSISLGKDIIAQRIQIPLDLSWAISVHKSQGMTMDKAILDLKHAWEYGQVYVAMSRVRSLEGLSLRYPLKSSHIKTHHRVKQFYQSLQTTETLESINP